MKCENLNKFLTVLKKHVPKSAMSEIEKIHGTLSTAQDITDYIKAACQILSLTLTYDATLWSYAWDIWRDMLSNSNLDREEVLDVLNSLSARQFVKPADMCLIQSLFFLDFENFSEGARRAKDFLTLDKPTGQNYQALWARCLAAFAREKQALLLIGKECRLERAKKLLQEAIELNPQYADAWAQLGTIHMIQGNFSKAVTNCKKALELNHKCTVAYWGLSYIYLERGMPQDAEDAVREGLKFSSNNAGLISQLGCVQMAQGKYLSAISSFKDAISSEREVELWWENLGTAYEKTNQIELAEDAFIQATNCDHSYWPASESLIKLLLRHDISKAAKSLGHFLESSVRSANAAPVVIARNFIGVCNSEFLYEYNFVSQSDSGGILPGCGKHIVDRYLSCVWQSSIKALRIQEIDSATVAENLRCVCEVWCFYADRLENKQFVRGQLYAIKQNFMDAFPQEVNNAGFASIWPQIEAKIGTASDEEFILQILAQEPKLLEAAGKICSLSDVDSLRWQLLLDLGVHVHDYQREHKIKHLEKIYHCTELLKGYMVLHKLANPKIMKTVAGMKIRNSYVSSLPTQISKTAIAGLAACTESLPQNAVALNFFFLRRGLLGNMFLVFVLKPGQPPLLKIIKKSTGRLEKFQSAAADLKRIHQQVAIKPDKTLRVGEDFYDLLGLGQGKRRKVPHGTELIKLVAELEKKHLRQAYEAVLDGVIDIEELRGKDLYISPSPEMYDIPFHLLLRGDEFLNQIVNSATIVPIFSLQQYCHKEYSPGKNGLVLYLGEGWENQAKKRARNLLGWCNEVTHQKIDYESSESVSDTEMRIFHGELIRAITEFHKDTAHVHIIGENELYSTKGPNLHQFERYLYELPQRLPIDLLSLEACWGGTWSAPEDMMGLFVSFLASGVSHIIASPYSVIPDSTSGNLFDHIYRRKLKAENGNIGLQVASAIRDAAEEVRQAKPNCDDTIPTLWGAYQLYGTV